MWLNVVMQSPDQPPLELSTEFGTLKVAIGALGGSGKNDGLITDGGIVSGSL
jgi:hypothetical protein